MSRSENKDDGERGQHREMGERTLRGGREYGYGEYGSRGMPPEEYGGYESERALWRGRGYGYGEYGSRDFPREGDPSSRGGYSGMEEGLWGGRGYGYGEYGSRGGVRERGGYDREAGLWRGRGYGYGQYGRREEESIPPDVAQGEMMVEEWRITGPMTGMGPESYRRTDERILEDVNERLTRHGRLDARNIQATVADGVVTLTGTVGNRHSRLMAEDTVDSVPGVRDIRNDIRVEKNR